MTLDEYLEHLTDNNWHALRQLIELERNTLEADREAEAMTAYELAKDSLIEASHDRWLASKR